MIHRVFLPVLAAMVLLSACAGGYRAPTDHRRQIELSDESFADPADCRNAYMRSVLGLHAASGSCGYAPK